MTLPRYQYLKKRLLHNDISIFLHNDISTFLVSLFMYLQRANTLPKIFNNYFLQNDDIHRYSTRSAKTLYVEYHRANYGTKIWNDLPDDIKKSNSYSIFKRKMTEKILFNM